MAAVFPPATAPGHVCILRLSAIGDTCHVVPLLHRLRRAWPQTRFTWVVGRLEARLVGLMPDVEFITVDKRARGAEAAAARAALRAGRYDLLLHLQVALRASLVARQVRADVRLGFDRARARELQWLFTNRRVAPRAREHVLDSFQGFADALGVPAGPLDFSLPLPESATALAAEVIPADRPTLLVSPCSSHALRNWRPDRYAAVIRHAAERHGLATILCGGPSSIERAMGAAIEAACPVPVVNRIGVDGLPQLLALMARGAVLLTPDSGPAHMGTLAGIPVIGLYAATNPARSGPYRSLHWCVDRHAEATRRFLGRSPPDLRWGTKVERPGAMELIEIADVTAKLDEIAAVGFEAARRMVATATPRLPSGA
jgi:heptosyltransferase I